MGFILLNFAQKMGALWIIEKPENRREKAVRCRVSASTKNGSTSPSNLSTSSNLQPPTSNLQPRTSNLQPPTSNPQPPTSNLEPPTSSQSAPPGRLHSRLYCPHRSFLSSRRYRDGLGPPAPFSGSGYRPGEPSV